MSTDMTHLSVEYPVERLAKSHTRKCQQGLAAAAALLPLQQSQPRNVFFSDSPDITKGSRGVTGSSSDMTLQLTERARGR